MKKTTNPDLLLASALAKHLLSPSRFESSALSAKAATHDGLRCLASLDKPTRLSLPLVTEEPAPAAAAPAVAAPAAAPADTSRFGSHKQEYQAGLENPTVIQALLEYHTRRRPLGPGQGPLAGFRSEQVARVAAQPKTRPRPAMPAGTTRIFRPRGD